MIIYFLSINVSYYIVIILTSYFFPPRKSRTTFDTTDVRKEIGPVIIEYAKVSSSIQGLKLTIVNSVCTINFSVATVDLHPVVFFQKFNFLSISLLIRHKFTFFN